MNKFILTAILVLILGCTSDTQSTKKENIKTYTFCGNLQSNILDQPDKKEQKFSIGKISVHLDRLWYGEIDPKLYRVTVKSSYPITKNLICNNIDLKKEIHKRYFNKEAILKIGIIYENN